MPNHITNIITSTDMKKLKELILNEKGEVDFNKLIPMPKELEITSGSKSFSEPSSFDDVERRKLKLAIIAQLTEIYEDSADRKDFVVKCLERNELCEYISEAINNKEVVIKDCEEYVQGFYNKKNIGYKDWYDWSCAKWGTKWNAYETEIGDTYIKFDTAWSSPDTFFQVLNSYINFTVAYADEDIWGNNIGIREYANNSSFSICDDISKMALGLVIKEDEFDEEIHSETNQSEVNKAAELMYEMFGFGSKPSETARDLLIQEIRTMMTENGIGLHDIAAVTNDRLWIWNIDDIVSHIETRNDDEGITMSEDEVRNLARKVFDRLDISDIMGEDGYEAIYDGFDILIDEIESEK